MRKGLFLCVLVLVVWPWGPAPVSAQGPPILAWEQEIRGDELAENEGKLRWPVAIAAAGEREFVVADAHGSRLLLFRHAESSVEWTMERAINLPQVPAALAFDGSRYVASLRGGGLVAFERPQLAMRPISLPDGLVPGALAARGDGTLLVADLANPRVAALGPDGSLRASIEVEQKLCCIAAGTDGGFFAAAVRPAEVYRYGANGQLIARWPVPEISVVPPWPSALTVSPAGEVILLDRHNGRVLVLGRSGQLLGTGSRKGRDPGLLLFPAGITVLGDQRMVVADLGNGRLQLFRRLDGRSTP